MKKITDIINEDFKLKKKGKIVKAREYKYKYHPKDKNELRSLLEQLLEERGEDADLNDIDVSAIQDFCYVSPDNYHGLFYKLDIGNIDISGWNMSNATNISYMFYSCAEFNSDISGWDVSNVEDMGFMFWYCKKFNCDLNNWNVKKLNYMYGTHGMFNGCASLTNTPSWYKK